MDAKTTSIVSYIGWIGWVIAMCAGDKEDHLAKFHLNQSLVLMLVSLVSSVVVWIPFIGWAWAIFLLVLAIMGIISAVNQEEKPLPLFGKIKILFKDEL